MIYVPPLHAELMSTTALTPTHHKGGGLRAIVGIAVAIAIPFAAPAIASSMALSGVVSAIGMTATSALIGGAIGALSAKVLGSDWKMGAIGGAIGGGLGGFAKSGGFSGIGGGTTLGGSADDFAGLSAAQLGGTPAATTSAGLLSAQPTSSFDYGTGFGAEFDAFGTPNPFEGAAGGFPVNRASGDLGAKLAGEYSMPTRDFPNAMNYGSRATSDPSFVYDYPTQSWAASDAGAAAARAPAVTPTAADPGFFDDFQGKLTRGVKSAFDPEKLAEKGLDAAGRLVLDQAAGYFADDIPVNPEEKARLAFLDQQRAEQGRLQGEKEKIALGLANQARSVQVSGQPESKAAKITAARAGETYIRGAATPALEAARRRQVNLDIAKRGGTAQIQGRTSGEERYRGLLTAAAGILPTGSALAKGAADDLAAADKRFLAEQAALGKQQKSFASIFGGLLPTGEDTDKEIEEAQKRMT